LEEKFDQMLEKSDRRLVKSQTLVKGSVCVSSCVVCSWSLFATSLFVFKFARFFQPDPHLVPNKFTLLRLLGPLPSNNIVLFVGNLVSTEVLVVGASQIQLSLFEKPPWLLIAIININAVVLHHARARNKHNNAPPRGCAIVLSWTWLCRIPRWIC
jgi:hypothetical protein